jgi:hypothetical protein
VFRPDTLQVPRYPSNDLDQICRTRAKYPAGYTMYIKLAVHSGVAVGVTQLTISKFLWNPPSTPSTAARHPPDFEQLEYVVLLTLKYMYLGIWILSTTRTQVPVRVVPPIDPGALIQEVQCILSAVERADDNVPCATW